MDTLKHVEKALENRAKELACEILDRISLNYMYQSRKTKSKTKKGIYRYVSEKLEEEKKELSV